MKIQDFLPIPDILKYQTILCVQPHPDDNEIGMGGTLIRYKEAGATIVYCTVSQGKGGSNILRAEELVKIRQNELREAGTFVGAVGFYQLNLSDSHYPDEKEICEQLVAIIREVKPDIVFTVDPYLMYEAHPTHRKTGMAVLEACMFASMKHFPKPDASTEPKVHRVQTIGFYASAKPNVLIDISTSFAAKLEAIFKHASQFDAQARMQLSQYLDMQATAFGQTLNVKKAEAFKILPMVLTHMMIESERY
jgi:LmbE family N-acetylglucosaminyl deacetylase